MNRRAAGAVALAGLAFGVGPISPAPASCAPPSVSVAQDRVRVGDEIYVSGQAWFNGCQDSGVCSAGCFSSAECDYGPPEKPIKNIRLFLKGDGTRHLLAEVSADSKFEFKTRVTVPNLSPGRYRLTGDYASGDTYDRVVVTILGPSSKQ